MKVSFRVLSRLSKLDLRRDGPVFAHAVGHRPRQASVPLDERSEGVVRRSWSGFEHKSSHSRMSWRPDLSRTSWQGESVQRTKPAILHVSLRGVPGPLSATLISRLKFLPAERMPRFSGSLHIYGPAERMPR